MSAHAVFYKKLQAKKLSFYIFCIICIGVVILNIVYSQKYNKNMYRVMEGESESVIVYLKHIWGSTLFNLEIEAYKNDGRTDILSTWEATQRENGKRIQGLEEALRLHPYSPELYYNLSLLYSENGDKIKANENLQKARQIDPSIQ